MSLWSFLRDFFSDAPKPPIPRHRRLRAVCAVCGKNVAVIASTGQLWRHACAKVEEP